MTCEDLQNKFETKIIEGKQSLAIFEWEESFPSFKEVEKWIEEISINLGINAWIEEWKNHGHQINLVIFWE